MVDRTGRLDVMRGRAGVVTGAGRGLGRAIALNLATAGARVAAVDIDPATADDTARLVREVGGEALPLKADIAIEDEVRQAIAAALHAFGSIDFACNNAVGPVIREPLIDINMETTRKMVDIALIGTALCIKHELRAMAGGEGDRSIVNISSTVQVRGEQGCGIYGACKAGIEGLTRVAANEHGPNGIRVNAIECGGMMTPALEEWLATIPGSQARLESRVPLRRIAAPEEVADSVLFLCSHLSSFVNGTVLVADGGGLLHSSAFHSTT